MKGKLIVIEGIDGSGKSTQLKMLQSAFKEKRLPFESLKFPQYKKTFFGKTIAQFLRGEIGDLRTINPYLISMVYAMDRAEARDQMYRWLNHGRTVLLDRYVSSNMAHQCGRLPKKTRGKFLRWIDELEYRINNVPREDIVIYLYMPYKVAQELMMNADRAEKDMVEDNTRYLKRSEETYLWLAKKYKHWTQIDCVDTEGNILSRDAIHTEILRVLQEKGMMK